ncbi:MAG: DUF167 domain-containing protein [Candidatus Moraniibacteriota bacterium]
MRIYVKVNTKSSQSRVEMLGEGNFKVWVNSAPERGKANKEAVKLLADYFSVSAANVKIIAGKTASKKLIEIEAENNNAR